MPPPDRDLRSYELPRTLGPGWRMEKRRRLRHTWPQIHEGTVMDRRPGTPSLLRELNDRAALDLLLGGELLTRSQISEHTGVSKVTVSQMLARLEDRGLVT